jgi:PPOX class probable F420-dependent enzyme
VPLTRAQINAFLASPRLAHFATTGSDGSPRVRPMWYAWDEGIFWLTTRRRMRRTGADLDASPVVALGIASEEFPYFAVVARGPVEVWEWQRESWLERMARRYDAYPQWYEGAIEEDDRVVLRMHPTEIASWDFSAGDYEALNAGRSLRSE